QQRNALLRLQADDQLVADQLTLLRGKDVVRRRLEVDNDLRQLLRHALAGTQVERHAGPAPVADFRPQRDEGFGVALGVGVFFLQIARYVAAKDAAGDVLAAHQLLTKMLRRNRRQ